VARYRSLVLAAINLAAVIALSVFGGWALGRLWKHATRSWPRRSSPLMPVWFGCLVCACLLGATAAFGSLGSLIGVG
jgi:hypothetical protein